MFADSRTRCPPTSNTSRCIAGHVYPYLCSAECRDNRLLLYWPRYERNKISQNSIDKKPRIPAFYQYHSGCVFYYRRIARKAEAGRGGILRSINISAVSGYVATDVFGRRTISPTIRKRLSATSSEHSTSILRSGLLPRPASDLS